MSNAGGAQTAQGHARAREKTPHPSQAERAAERTRAAQDRFLEAFATCGNVSLAAECAGVGRRTVYGWANSDAAFQDAMSDAREQAVDALEAEARRRALQGVERPVFQKGSKVGSVTEYSDRLLEVLLKANRPEKYADRSKTELSVGTISAQAIGAKIEEYAAEALEVVREAEARMDEARSEEADGE